MVVSQGNVECSKGYKTEHLLISKRGLRLTVFFPNKGLSNYGSRFYIRSRPEEKNFFRPLNRTTSK